MPRGGGCPAPLIQLDRRSPFQPGFLAAVLTPQRLSSPQRPPEATCGQVSPPLPTALQGYPLGQDKSSHSPLPPKALRDLPGCEFEQEVPNLYLSELSTRCTPAMVRSSSYTG